MADDIRTLGEATHVVNGINSRLSLMTAVFAASVAMAAGAFVYLNGKVDVITDSIADIRTSSALQNQQLQTVNANLTEIATGIQGIPAKLNPPAATPTSTTSSAIEFSSPVGLYGLSSERLYRAIKSNSPPPKIDFALASSNPVLLASFKDALGGDLRTSELLAFDASQLVALPAVLRKVTITPLDNLILLSNDGDYMLRLQRSLHLD